MSAASLTRIWEIEERVDRLHREPQTPEREVFMTDLKMERDVLQSALENDIASLTRLLFNAFKKTGQMQVIFPNGARMHGSPHVTSDPVQNIWNIKSEARNLAQMRHTHGAKLPQRQTPTEAKTEGKP